MQEASKERAALMSRLPQSLHALEGLLKLPTKKGEAVMPRYGCKQHKKNCQGDVHKLIIQKKILELIELIRKKKQKVVL